MVDILDEAIEDIKEERVQRLFARYGKIFAVFVVLFIVCGIGYIAWKNYGENKVYKAGGDYMTAMLKLQSKDYEKGADMMQELAAGNSTYSALAALNYASFLSAKQEFRKASQVYKTMFENKEFDQVFKDFARLMYISMHLNAKEIDAAQGIKDLSSYIEAKPIFKTSALEQKAALHLSLGDKKAAKEALTEIIASKDTPNKMRQRAEQLMVLTSNE